MEDKEISKEDTSSSGPVVMSDNDKGNPYHKKSDGKFTSKDNATLGSVGNSETTSTEHKKGDALRALFDKKESKLSSLMKRPAISDKPQMNLSKILSDEVNFVEQSPGITTLKKFLENREKRKNLGSPSINFSSEELEILRDKQKEIFSTANLARSMPISDIIGFLDEGQLGNLFQYLGRGSTSKYYRSMASIKMFGSDVKIYEKDIPHSEEEEKKYYNLEKYGFLGDSDILDLIKNNNGSGYADSDGALIIFDRDRMDYRTTFTIDDSLGSGADGTLLPQLINRDIDAYTFAEDYNKPDFSVFPSIKKTHELVRACAASYIELQFHGEVTPKDLKAIAIKPSNVETERGRKILEKAKEYGFKVYTTGDAGNALYSVEIDEKGIIKYNKEK